ncbi:MAG: heavy metal sensor histidine kinase [Rubrivivax sp.]|nr:heavy metal sensor histidine kinase [Rubrivivax sp.]MDP3610299.1 heavy metal sensor histidine kinase [Rubrivivax sp.]
MDTLCSHSISGRLSKKLALFTIAVLGLLSITSWMAVEMLITERKQEELLTRCELVSDILALEARSGGEAAVVARLRSDAPMRAHTRLEVWRADGQPLYADTASSVLQQSSHVRTHDFVVKTDAVPGGELRARWTMDYTRDARMGKRWALALTLITLAAGGLVALGTGWHVRRQLQPLRSLAVQTRGISPQHLHQRLSLEDPAEELRPWVDQFNALMGRLEQSYAQLEGFNADVAHELRTPLANLIGQTEVALSRERSVESLRDTLVSNLEEMQRLSAMVNDMLFLSHADRGAVARRGQPVSLASLAQQVVEFHEAPLEEAGLQLRVEGDALLPVDESLFKRAVSNLLGNATRFARRGSTVVIGIRAEAAASADAADQVQVLVQNEGEAIDAGALPRLFDRFFRADTSRCCDEGQHHGLGLAIVAAIARMHAGRTVAESSAGITRVGFTLATG